VTLASQKIRFIMDLRRGGISDTRVLSAMERVPREDFVPQIFIDQAYENVALPIGYGQTISQPHVVAFMTQALDVSDRLMVLEIGTGSGYQTAVLSHLARRVYTIERAFDFRAAAEKRFAAMKRHNITTKVGDGGLGWPEQAPFARIIVTAAAADIPPKLADQLAPDGIMVVPIGDDREHQQIVRVRRTPNGFDSEDLGPARFVTMTAGVEDAERGAG
jgi:protein-L-isoaspartate(D-aspartate) O-methyltransferase